MNIYVVETDSVEDWEGDYRYLDSAFSTKELAESYLIREGFKCSLACSNWTKNATKYAYTSTVVGRIIELELDKENANEFWGVSMNNMKNTKDKLKFVVISDIEAYIVDARFQFKVGDIINAERNIDGELSIGTIFLCDEGSSFYNNCLKDTANTMSWGLI